MTQELVIATVKQMPIEFEVKDLIERLHFIEQVNVGLDQIAQGKTIPHEDVLNTIKGW